MNTAHLRARLRASAAACHPALPALRAWAAARLRERSTWIGIATALTSFGYSTWGDHLTGLADVLPMIAGGVGAALTAASTSAKPASVEGDA